MATTPEGGLTAYVNRVREDHRRLSNGWCSCDTPLCPQRYLLDHIDDLLEAYQLKVQDFAAETVRASEQRTGEVMPQRRRYATRAELVTLVAEHINTTTGDTIDESSVAAVLSALEAHDVDPAALVQVTVDEPGP
jgi:hypothetical protein